MKVLLTGATGLLGSHLMEQLTSNGHQVTALVREIPARSFLGSVKPTCELIQGDLFNNHIPGEFDTVIHAAAMTSADHSKKEELWRVNFEGTQKFYQQMKNRFGVWVQVSSISTLCNGTQNLVTENHQGQCRPTPYAESKLAADQWLDAQSAETLVVHPCYMLGKWDSKPSSGAIFHAVKMGKISRFQNAVKNFVSPRDVSRGILQAIANGSRGHYILGNENVEIAKFFNLLADEMNIDSPMTPAPLTAESADWMKEFCVASSVSIEKAQKVFGYSPQVNLPEMLRETMNYFEQYKLLRRTRESRPSA